MPEFLKLLAPDDARNLLLGSIEHSIKEIELVPIQSCLDRIVAEDVKAPHPLPEFVRSTVDGYALQAKDGFGATDSQPAYLTLRGEVQMGAAPELNITPGTCALIHTGGMLPAGADAVVMLENTQKANAGEIEILRSVAEGENVIAVGEDVRLGQIVIGKGCRVRPAEIGGLVALGITELRVFRKIRVGLIATGDEVIPPENLTQLGQVRDINTYTLRALVDKFGGESFSYGILPDKTKALTKAASQALAENDLIIITAGSSASARDMTAEVIQSLGRPGVIVHGINTKPGKPTILGVCNGKAVIGLPGNPVSALVNGYLFVLPAMQKIISELPRASARITAQLSVNLASQAGREDWWPVKLTSLEKDKSNQLLNSSLAISEKLNLIYKAEPIFGKSNLIFNLVAADGLLRVPSDSTGLEAGAVADVLLI